MDVSVHEPEKQQVVQVQTPWKHQLEALEMMKHSEYFALFFEVGTGKTFTAIQFIRDKCIKHGAILSTLVLCPPIVIENWRREFFKFSRLGPVVLPITGTKKQRLDLIQTALEKKQHKILVANYETLLMKECFQALLDFGFDILIADESHKCKSTTAKRTKQTVLLADRIKYKVILTGTPILNTPMDLFSQVRILDRGQALGKNYFAFRAEYFYDKNSGMPSQSYFPNWVVRPGALERLKEKIAPFSMVAKKSECLDLPPLVKQTVFVELSPSQRKAYEQMKKDFITFVENQACVASMALTKLLRLQQIVSGFVTPESKEGEGVDNVLFKENPKAEALTELLTDLTGDHKCIVWAVFRQDYETIRRVCARLKITHVEIHGETPQVERQEAMDAFNNSPDVRVLLGNPQSGGVGVNLTSASYSIFYSRGFSLEHDLQAEARNYRAGSEVHDKVTRIDIVAQNTVDELILKRLANKIAISDKVLQDIVNEIKHI